MANQGEQVIRALNALANRFCAIECEGKARMISLFREKIPLDNLESSHTLRNYCVIFIFAIGRIESSLHVSNYKENMVLVTKH